MKRYLAVILVDLALPLILKIIQIGFGMFIKRRVMILARKRVILAFLQGETWARRIPNSIVNFLTRITFSVYIQ